jgi:hypothetical protein
LIAVVAPLAVAGCSPGADYPSPSIFPAVHDMPPPRNDTTMNPLQVQQATEDLISERNHLTAQASSPGSQATGNPPATSTNARPVDIQAVARAPATGQSATSALAPAQTPDAETK